MNIFLVARGVCRATLFYCKKRSWDDTSSDFLKSPQSRHTTGQAPRHWLLALSNDRASAGFLFIFLVSSASLFFSLRKGLPDTLLGTAFWLGLLTSISPCPLATNIAAISFVGRRVDSPSKVFLAGLLYTIGRTVTYLVLGILLVTSLLSAPSVSQFLQKYMPYALGPLLILVGLVLLDVIRFRFSGSGLTNKMQKHIETLGVWGALFLGIVFSLSFCPVSAALFFGSLLPLCFQHHSSVLLPLVYGIATGLPVLMLAVLIAFGTKQVGLIFNRIGAFEKWARRVTGTACVLVGLYETVLNFINF